MTKTEAVTIFGSQAELARALEITKSAVSQWPDQLDRNRSDRVMGAAHRLGKAPPLTRGTTGSETTASSKH